MAFHKNEVLEMHTRVEDGDSGDRNSILDESVAWAVKPGNRQDEDDMRRMGQKQSLSRNFHSFSILGLTTMVMNIWAGWLDSNQLAIDEVNRGGAIWVFLASWVLSLCTVVSLAEMASIAPSSGGQYHWVSEFAWPQCQKLMSYMSGWLSALGWHTSIAGGCYAFGVIILILVEQSNPGYTRTAWQETLLCLLVAFCIIVFNVWGGKQLPSFEGCALLFSFIGVFVVCIPLWVLAPKASSSEVWLTFDGYAGWTNIGLASLIAQVQSGGALVGADAAAHMSEEVRNASLVVPWMMVLTLVLNGAICFMVAVTYLYSIQDVTVQIGESTATFPFLDVFKHAVGSNAGAIGMTAPFVVLTLVATISTVAAASRQTWAFARDEGLPFPKFWTKVRVINGTPTPVNSIVASIWLAVVCALLNLAGNEVFDTIVGLGTGAISGTYVISIAAMIMRRFSPEPLPQSRFSLGKFGLPLNIIALLYQAQLIVFCYFPEVQPVTGQNMNYSSVVYGGVILLAAANYFVRARKYYTGPVVHVKRN